MSDYEQFRPLLIGLAYRMLGSVAEAEDIVQDALIRAAGTPAAQVRHPQAYVTTITTRLCLNFLNSARVQREQYMGPWLPEPVATENSQLFAGPDKHAVMLDSISIAFLHLLESLTPLERAVYLLRDVFDYDYREIAEMLDRREAACRQLYSRAKRHISDNRPRFDVDPDEHRQLLEGFIRVVEEGDVDEFLALLANDVVLVPDGGGQRGAAIRILSGREKVGQFVIGVRKLMPPGARYVIESVNGHPAVVIRRPDRQPFVVIAITPHLGQAKIIHVIGGQKLTHLHAS